MQTRPIRAGGQLMHSKYVIRDATTTPAETGLASAAVWTGSTNFTDDAWTRQENNIITIASAPLADGYRTDFDQMWTTGTISHTGRGRQRQVQRGLGGHQRGVRTPASPRHPTRRVGIMVWHSRHRQPQATRTGQKTRPRG
ncbi:hypothetical protein I6A60_24860 [Frankia sp. AgB1.9]|uniref:phospholipase D-like domain-containing protein n=1 Tax=unclassified Frankia TaxID=2632575 RepID=UPI0019331F35|nr:MULTISPECIES: phospholipase D-like domain-containing protein [unclassified Frankia]MBL7487412.1 hypothetical protein [Frankia sp. AgW1.1]MBL7551071.1 hypothetical protein [Frankia sp. AgB1.9]MBL7618851.1 hypothetical protein [Frankia sp. AgB1.8]